MIQSGDVLLDGMMNVHSLAVIVCGGAVMMVMVNDQTTHRELKS